MAATSVEDLQEAFFNFDEEASGYISLETLRLMVEDFMAEAQQFSDGRGNVDYKAFAQCMLGNDE